jgi:hypothetical protein
MTHETDRFDDEGGFLSVPHRSKAAKKRFFKAAVAFCKAVGSTEWWQPEHIELEEEMLKRYKEWHDA